MKENEDILEKAVKSLRNEQFPPSPPQQTVDATIAKLTQSSEQLNTPKIGKRLQIIEIIRASKIFTKFAAAAVLLIVAGYVAGRFSAPQSPDIKQLQAAIEPAIRQNLLDQIEQYQQLTLASNYVRLKDELSQQYRSDLNRFAVQTLAASNAVTNQLLTELVQSINAAQTQDLRRIAAALEQIELNRLQDKNQLTNGLETLAYQTEGELQRTRQDMVQFLANTQPGGRIPDASEKSNIPE